jgi:hypothetical protein
MTKKSKGKVYQEYIVRILRREYLRGFIDGGASGRKYTWKILQARYRKYIKDNPSVRFAREQLAMFTPSPQGEEKK